MVSPPSLAGRPRARTLLATWLSRLQEALHAVRAGTVASAPPPTLELQALRGALRACEAERDRLREALTRFQERQGALEAQNRELDAFSRSVSHDLLAPLRHIRGFSELLRKSAQGALPERAEHCLEAIATSASRADALVHALLGYARTGDAPLEPRPVPLETLVAEVRQELAPDWSAREIDWRLGPLPWVMGDPTLLRQAVQHLLGNALKYTLPREATRIEVGATVDADRVVIHVRDNGVGFAPEQGAQLFSPFVRLHPASQFEGNGVGLASVRRIVERHGGQAWAEGRPGHGATFFFSLPRAPAVPEVAA